MSKTILHIIVEGETEQMFANQLLVAHLSTRSVTVIPTGGAKSGKRFGVRKWAVALGDIERRLKSGNYCTTMVDFYAMPNDWPGRSDSKDIPWNQRASLVEAQMMDVVNRKMGPKFNPKFFIPYVQLHEFEALAFSDVRCLADVVAPDNLEKAAAFEAKFASMLSKAGHPEAINDGYETCPSRRIESVAPAYKKTLHGPIVTSRIGLDVLRQKCTHFGEWLTKLEQLNGSGTTP